MTSKVKVRNKYRADMSKKQRLQWLDELASMEQYARVIAQPPAERRRFTTRNTSAVVKAFKKMGVGNPGQPEERLERMQTVRATCVTRSRVPLASLTCFPRLFLGHACCLLCAWVVLLWLPSCPDSALDAASP